MHTNTLLPLPRTSRCEALGDAVLAPARSPKEPNFRLIHDLSNAMTVIVTNSDLLLEQHRRAGTPPEELVEIYDAAERATALIRDLMREALSTPSASALAPEPEVMG